MNATEQRCELKYRWNRMRALRSGWPDFLMIDPDGNPLGGVEVKRSLTELRPNQIEMLTALSKFMPVFVAVDDGRTRIHYKFPFEYKDGVCQSI